MEHNYSEWTDSHGSLDLHDEIDWKNVSFSSSEKTIEINGANLNSLLKGLFLLFSKGEFADSLPGGIACWEEIVQPTFICLNQICTMEEILGRICFLFSKIVHEKEESGGGKGGIRDRKQTNLSLNLSLFQGSIWFLWYWVIQFHDFIQEKEKFILFSYCKILFASVSLFSKLFPMDFLQLFPSLMEFLSKNCLTMSNEKFAHFQEPNFFQIEGNWDGNEILTTKDKVAALKSELSKGPKIKFEIFGADNLFDDDSDDDDENNNNNDKNKNLNETESQEPIIHFPQSRILQGISLLSLRETSILEFDAMELARQWTIIDHQLFKQIPIYEILQSCFSTNALNQDITTKLLENMKANGIRKLVDQFNASSLWVTSLILSGPTPADRANTLTKFIKIAHELHKLGNFHALMIILTAIQQGCIARLLISFDMIPKTELTTLNSLKKLMAGAKNYALYRDELTKISMNLPLEKSEQGKTVVPHLAAHYGALTGITECHTDFLPENVHLLNITKWKLCTSIVALLHRLQKLKYNLRPVRVIVSGLHAEWKDFFLKPCLENIDLAKHHFHLSNQKETLPMIQDYLTHRKDKEVVKEKEKEKVEINPVPPVHDKDDSDSEPPNSKRRAYNRIKNFSERTESKGMKRSESKLAVLKRMFSLPSVTFRENIEESEEDEGSDEQEENNSQDKSRSTDGSETSSDEKTDEKADENQSDHAEEESDLSDSKPAKKGRFKFRSLLRNFWQ